MIDFLTAKNYISEGYSVFPVILSWSEQEKKFNKRPAVDWKIYQERLATDEELHTWFDKPTYNGLGLATGELSGVVVVDIEASATQEDRDSLHSPMIAKTISGGFHYYFKWTKEIRNKVKIQDKQIDFRGDGGYVVIPPSACNGQGYTWEKQVERMYLSALPEEFCKVLQTSDIPQGLAQSFADRSVSNSNGQIFKPAEIGARNMTSAQISGYIATKIPREFWEPYGWLILKDWNDKNPTPLSENELRTTWNSIKTTDVRNHPFKIEEGEIAHVFAGDEALSQFRNLKKQYGDGLTTGFAELDKYFTFLPEQLYLISAPTHHGKTMFALNMASRIATLGHKVLFCSLEQGVFITQFVEGILGGCYPDNLWLLTSDKMMSVENLIDTVQKMEEKPELLCVDHLHFLKKNGKGATEDLDQIILEIQNAAKTLGIPILVICHVRKLNADRPPEMDDLRDSSSLSQVPSVVMFLYRKRSETPEDSYLASNGILFLPKNRIQGKTGAIKYILKPTGEMIFQSRNEETI